MPDYTAAHSYLGIAHQELGELAEAEKHFREVIKLDSTDILNRFRLVKVILDHSSAHTRERLMEAIQM